MKDPRVVRGSPVLPWNHPDLIPTLASVLLKMAFSPAPKIDQPIDLNRQYRLVTPKSWAWRNLDPDFTLQFARMPHPQANNFYLLTSLGRGENGVAWLASSETGEACVIKFQAVYRNPPSESALLSLQNEAARWRDIWGAGRSRVVTLVRKAALIMPYVKTFGEDIMEPTPEMKELARQAIDRMLDRGHVHRDLRWDHVGVCRNELKGQEEAVFIDLGNVDKLAEGDEGAKEAARREMLEALKLEI